MAAAKDLRGLWRERLRRIATHNAGRPSGDFLATAPATTTTAPLARTPGVPSREDFAKLLEESFDHGNLQEGAVIKGTVVGIEKDLAVIDVGLKTEGRVPLREFSGPGRHSELKIGDTVEVYL